MPKRTRSRTRARLASTRPATEAVATSRTSGLRGSGAPRATGAASSGLQKAAALERAYVVKDFRRIGVVVAAMLALLVASGIGVNLFLR